MPQFNFRSLARLDTCHPKLKQLFREVVKHRDCTILCGVRSKDDQDAAKERGASRLRWPQSKHNVTAPGQLSRAVDVAPWPLDWGDMRRFDVFSGFVLGVASQLGIAVRWGGDWDGDHDLRDQSFNDLVHFEVSLEQETAA
jgi:peptidoglycan LD-endopeptidase CwlK